MRQRLFILALCAGMVVFGACGFDRKGVTSAGKPAVSDTASSSDTSDTGNTDTGSTGTGSTDTGSTDTGSSSDTSDFSDTSSFSDSSSSDFGTTGSLPSTTSSTTGGLGGYSDAFKSSFLQGCASDPTKRPACQCVIDKISTTIPFDEFLSIAGTGNTQKLLSDPRFVKIITDCKLGA